MIVLDDVLSALDSETERAVFDALFARHGFLRTEGVTVVMATHAGERLRPNHRL